jgi:RNA polymerase sigma factor (sigma-70 family)
LPDPEIYDENILLRRVAAGDPLAFRELVGAYKDKVYTAGIRLLGNRERAEDSMQDVFLKIGLNREKLPGVENFGGWLHTITRNTLISALKRLAREKTINLAVADDFVSGLTVEEMLMQKENRILFRAAIDALPARQYEVYHLVKEEGLKREEAAARLGISLDTVKYKGVKVKSGLHYYP